MSAQPLNSDEAKIDSSQFPTNVLHLRSIGSNSHGQLGLGHRDDVHRFERAFSWTGNQHVEILGFSAGGRHSLFLIEIDGLKLVYGCGDRAQDQLICDHQHNLHHTGSPQNSVWTTPRLIDVRGSLISRLHNLDDESREALRLYEPVQVASCWETSFVVLRTLQADDQMVSFGSNDFELRGVSSLLSGSDPNLVQIPRAERETTTTGSPRRVRLFSGPRHLIAIVQNEQSTEPLQIFGWGASRQGQLGQTQANGSRSTQPIRIYAPFDLPPDPSLVKVAVGKEHTIIICPNKIWCLGSGRNGQHDVHLTGLDPQSVIAVEACWNTSFVVHELESGGSQVIQCFGKNSHNQLGLIGSDLKQSRHPLPSSCLSLSAGSEHVLLLNKLNQVWGWGWNEHGNLGLKAGEPLELTRSIDLIVENAPNDQITHVLAGCATSFVCYRTRES